MKLIPNFEIQLIKAIFERSFSVAPQSGPRDKFVRTHDRKVAWRVRGIV